MATKIFARLRNIGTARASGRVLLASTLVALTPLSQASDYEYAGYTGYDASVTNTSGAQMTNKGAKPLPPGTEFRVQIYSNPDPLSVSGYPSAVATYIDPILSCPGVTLNQSMPGPNVPGEGLLLDMRCTLISELAPGKSAEVRAGANFVGCLPDGYQSARRIPWLGRMSVALPNGYMDEQPSNDATLLPLHIHPLPPCGV